ncbi:hypothetical protein Gpo141_00012798, partial [Globisporangium polare]
MVKLTPLALLLLALSMQHLDGVRGGAYDTPANSTNVNPPTPAPTELVCDYASNMYPVSVAGGSVVCTEGPVCTGMAPGKCPPASECVIIAPTSGVYGCVANQGGASNTNANAIAPVVQEAAPAPAVPAKCGVAPDTPPTPAPTGSQTTEEQPYTPPTPQPATPQPATPQPSTAQPFETALFIPTPTPVASTPSPTPVAVTPTPTTEASTPVPTPAPVTPTLAAVTPTPTTEASTPAPTPVAVTPTPTTEASTPAPTPVAVTSTPTTEASTPAAVTPTPTTEASTPVPTPAPVTPTLAAVTPTP